MAILTLSGGAGIVSTDFVEEQGLTIADLAESTRTALRELFPAWMPSFSILLSAIPVSG